MTFEVWYTQQAGVSPTKENLNIRVRAISTSGKWNDEFAAGKNEVDAIAERMKKLISMEMEGNIK